MNVIKNSNPSETFATVTQRPKNFFLLYTTSWCGDCIRLKYFFQTMGLKNGRDYEEIDVGEDEFSAEKVREINQGNLSVPTLVFTDGSILTEPSSQEFMAHWQKI